MTGHEELTKMHAPKPTSKTGLKRKLITPTSNFNNNTILSFNDWDASQPYSSNYQKTDFTTVNRSTGSSAGLDSPVNLDVGTVPNTPTNGMPPYSSTSTQAVASRPPPPTPRRY